MHRRAFGMSGILLAVLALTLGLSVAGETQKAPDASKVEVTYYYLPG